VAAGAGRHRGSCGLPFSQVVETAGVTILTTRRTLLAAALALPLLAACGSSAPTTVVQAGGASATTTAVAPAPTTDPPTAATTTDPAPPAGLPTASVAPTGSAAAPGIPAITANATDLTQAPTVAAGTGTPSTSLVVRDLVVGTGTAATAADTVSVRYVGTVFSTGKVFDASWTRGMAPISFPISGVVPGFGAGVVGMKPGGRRELVIPPALGYGPSGGQPQAGISATDTIVFVVDYVGPGSS